MGDVWRALTPLVGGSILAATVWENHVWVANGEGVWTLALDSRKLEQRRTSAIPPLNVLLRAAMKRADVSAGTPSAMRAMWLPRVELEGNLKPSGRLTYMPDTGSAGENDRSWGVMARLTWTPPGRTSALPWDGEDVATTGERLLFPSGEQGMMVLDQSALPRAVGTTRRTSRGAARKSHRVVDLYAQICHKRETPFTETYRKRLSPCWKSRRWMRS